jgi:ferric-dicitrate binding protein FerR (iron transport regulator)
MKRVFARALRRRASGRLYPRAGTRTALRAAALLVAAALLNLTAARAAPASTAARAYTGEITFVEGVTVDGSPAASGQTLFPGSVVTTAKRSHTTVNLGPLGRLELARRTSLALDFGEAGASCNLDAGRVRVYAPAASVASVKTAEAAVSNAGAETAVFSVETVKGATTVVVQSGRAEVRAGGATRLLAAGETFTTAPQGAGRNNLSDNERKGLYVAIAGAVAAVLILLAARGGDAEDDVIGGCIDVLSGESHCF